ncbi:MOSC domain-containing protein [Novosphingobium mangrovi (ex Huang et al. 2023)]|uniref:MOSC domain-containing protein n=1 Tax=Novosphingobium mangrovi (ex Huang et al. 2023) TaxID=2976432 RepID=A0ABT2I2M9_9SPHN|nr:MOSC domain-containing protein [Novosphingobium mangrovi (ex Huang et al. 2023)]MCT2399065.1 MOSC domain-containing protein [Novosphingobium mangrovi (ex Huang et al. 2023)]
MTSPVPILSVQCGKVRSFQGPDKPSAIAKVPVDGPVRVHRLGLAGDEQADLTVHGGPDKAIHHYAHDHYGFWSEVLGDHPLLLDYGAFGENISTHAMTEETVCIGDRYRLGTALVEVSQGRQPCWKLDHRFGGLPVNARMVKARRAGWYYRVLEEGEVGAGDAITLLERPHGEWTVSRTFGLLVAGDHKRDREGLEALGALDVLAEPWKARRAKLLGI